MSSGNSLVEIPISEWSKLRDMYQDQRTRASAYNMLHVFNNWMTKNPELNIRIFSLNGDWQSDGTFIAQENTFIFFNTLSDNHDRLLTALNCLEQKSDYLLSGFQDRFLPTVEQHLLATGLQREDFKPDPTVWYHIPREPPAGITVRSLEPHQAEYIDSVWLHRSPPSLEFVRKLIRHNVSVGAFDASGKLLAWCLELSLGSLGALQVEEQHKRRGLGSLVVRCIAKKLMAQDIEVLAPVVVTNVPSRSMFEKLGALPVDRVHWAQKRVKKEA